MAASSGVSLASSTASQYSAVQEWAEREMIKRLEMGNLDLWTYCIKKPLPRGNGRVVRWTRMGNFGNASLLTEGTAPTAVALSAYTLTGTVIQRGNYTTPSDIWNAASVAGAVNDVVPDMTFSMKRAIDTVIRNVAIAGSTLGNALNNISVVNFSLGYGLPAVLCGGGGNVPDATALSALISAHYCSVGDIRRAVNQLKNHSAMPFGDGFFKLFMHPNVADQLRTTSEFQAWNQYIANAKYEQGYVGKVEGCEVIESNNMYWDSSGTATPGTVSAYHSILLGQGAIGTSELQKPQVIINRKPDKYDPLGQWTTVGYKFAIATALLNKSAGRDLVSTGLAGTKPPKAW